MTTRLYYDDPLLCRFEARVVGHGRWQGRPSVLLDRSAFYPESGGQMADRGTLDGVALIDVQVDETGGVHHLLDGPLPPVDATVCGLVDRRRRRIHMALHTGQHILSRALCDEAGASTVSSRLGESTCTIDIDKSSLADGLLGRVEELANDVVDDDPAVRAFFPDERELSTLELRREAKVAGPIRVVAVGDFDVTPCGGTHCTSAAQVGLVAVTGVERHKQRLRIHFAAGGRARRGLAQHAKALGDLASRFSCGPLDVAAAVDKLQRQLREGGVMVSELRERLASSRAAELAAGSERHVVALLEDTPVELLRVVAKGLVERGKVALLATRAEGALRVVLAAPDDGDARCGEWMRSIAAARGGRGGGRPHHAEGSLPVDTDWVGLASALGAS